MFKDDKNLRDIYVSPESPFKNDTSVNKILSYKKLNKLITALYMVTDIMDNQEPLRTKLRFLGAEILSDSYLLYRKDWQTLINKTDVMVSFIELSQTINLISEMNSSILKKEFVQFRNFLMNLDSRENNWLSDFISNEKEEENLEITQNNKITKSIVQEKSTSIGVQKGGTFMKALSEKITTLSDKKNVRFDSSIGHQNNFEDLKHKRREEILKIIKDNNSRNTANGGTTIKDIKTLSSGVLKNCGEKTLQRELISMLKDGVLKKVGEKRWSRYFL